MRASVDFNKQILIEVLYCNGVQTMGWLLIPIETSWFNLTPKSNSKVYM